MKKLLRQRQLDRSAHAPSVELGVLQLGARTEPNERRSALVRRDAGDLDDLEKALASCSELVFVRLVVDRRGDEARMTVYVTHY